MEYVGDLHAILAWDKHSQAQGILAAEIAPEGFLTSRVDFISDAPSIWRPRVVETLRFAFRMTQLPIPRSIRSPAWCSA